MAFSNKDLVDKLNKLNETQQSIEGACCREFGSVEQLLINC